MITWDYSEVKAAAGTPQRAPGQKSGDHVFKGMKKKTVNLFCLYFLSFCVVGGFCFFCFAKPDDPAEITVPFSLQYLFKSRNLDMSTVIVSRPMFLHLRNRKWIVFM